MTVPEDIQKLRHSLYANAEILWWASLLIALGTQVLMLMALWIDNKWIVVAGGLLTLVAPILIIWLREKDSTATVRADKCRRLILYADGLGRPINSEELSEVRAWGMCSSLQDAKFIAPYYTSAKSVGPNRLADIVAESSFFTYQLCERVLGAFWIVFAVSLIMVVSLLFLSDLLASSLAQGITVSIENVAKSVALVIAFLLSADFLLLIKRYSDLRSTAHNTFRQCVSLRDKESLQEAQILWIVEDYNISVSRGPLIPGFFYRKYKDELNRVYRDSNK